MRLPRPSRGHVVLAVATVTFAVLGWVVVPRMIESAYRGEGFPPLAAMIARVQRSRDLPLEKYQSVWAELRRVGLATLLGGWLVVAALRGGLHRWFTRAFVVPCTPGTLGAIRCLAFGLLLSSAVLERLPSVADLPPRMRVAPGFIRLFEAVPGFAALHQDRAALAALQAATVASLLLAAVGLATRLTAPLGVAFFFLFGGMISSYSYPFHEYLITWYVAAAVALTPCADGWSVDRLLRLARGRPVPDPDEANEAYGWGRMLCWGVVAVPYCLAGLSKLLNGGLSWITPDTMRAAALRDSLNPPSLPFPVPESLRLGLHAAEMPGVLISGMLLVSLLVEVLYPAVLFSRRARWVVPPVAAAMHVGIMTMQLLPFFDYIAIQAIFWDWKAIRLRLAERLAGGRGGLRVALGPSPSGPRIAAVLHGLDLFDRLRFVDADPSEEATGAPPVAGDPAWPRVVLPDGRVEAGPRARSRIARTLPLAWPVAPLVGHAWFDAGLGRAWRAIAGDGPGRAPAPFVPSPRRPHPALGFSGLLLFAMTCLGVWYNGRAFFPFSTWRMYSAANVTGHTQYFKILALYEDGTVGPAPIERWMPTLRESRFRPIILTNLVENKTDVGVDLSLVREFFEACIAVANRGVPPGRRVRSLEVQSFDIDMHDPRELATRGHRVKTFRHPDDRALAGPTDGRGRASAATSPGGARGAGVAIPPASPLK